MATKNEVTKAPTGGALAVPDFMKGDAGGGMGNVGADDVAIPRIALLQGLSKPVSEGQGRASEFFHLITEHNFGNELEVIPVLVSKSYLLWRPRETGGGILARADDGIHWTPNNATFNVKLKSGADVVWSTAPTVAQSGLDVFGSENPAEPQSPPAATKLLNILLYLPEYPEMSPSVFSAQRATLKSAKKFVGKLQMSAAPTYGQKFIMKSEKVNGPKGEFWSPVFVSNGFVQDAGLYETLRDMSEHFRKTGIRVDETGLDAEADVGDSGGSVPNDDRF